MILKIAIQDIVDYKNNQTQPSKTQIKYSLAHVWKMEETTTVGSGVDF